MALLRPFDLLLLDEITVDLDVLTRMNLLNFFKEGSSCFLLLFSVSFFVLFSLFCVSDLVLSFFYCFSLFLFFFGLSFILFLLFSYGSFFLFFLPLFWFFFLTKNRIRKRLYSDVCNSHF